MIYVAGYLPNSTVNGEGLRKVLFVSGCSLHCPNCHNREFWNKEAGEPVSIEDLYKFITQDKYIKKLTLSGGEPFEQAEELSKLVKLLKRDSYEIISFSGYTIEEIFKDDVKIKLLKELDGLIDGRYQDGYTEGKYKYSGSSNQRWFNREDIKKILTSPAHY